MTNVSRHDNQTVHGRRGRDQRILEQVVRSAMHQLCPGPKDAGIDWKHIPGLRDLIDPNLDLGQAFSDIWLLLRFDGTVVPPAISQQLFTRGLRLLTNAEGSISLAHLPPGTYDFWPYRSEAEGQMLYDTGWAMAAPISLDVVSGENSATVRLRPLR